MNSGYYSPVTHPWQACGPFLRSVEKLAWEWTVVLKREDLDVYQETQRLRQGQPPGAEFDDAERQRRAQLWAVTDLAFSEG